MGQMGQTRCNGNFDWSGRAKPDHVCRDGGGERRAAGTSHWDLHLRVMSARAAPSIHTSLKTRRRRMIVCFVFNFRKEKKKCDADDDLQRVLSLLTVFKSSVGTAARTECIQLASNTAVRVVRLRGRGKEQGIKDTKKGKVLVY